MTHRRAQSFLRRTQSMNLGHNLQRPRVVSLQECINKVRKDETMRQGDARAQRRFLACYEEVGMVLDASRWAKIHRSTHYRWLEDPVYRQRFEAARIRAAQQLEDEAVRRARYGVAKMVLYKGQPVIHRGKPVVEHEFSDRLMEKLLEANDPDRFNRQRVAPFDADSLNLENLTRGQRQQLMEWLKKQLDVARREMAAKAIEDTKQIEGSTIEIAPAQAKDPVNFQPPYRADGWPYMRAPKKKRKPVA
jgi:hypothetical protein